MKKNTITLVLIIAACVLSGYAQSDKAFVSIDGRFSVIPPVGFEKLKYETETTSTDGGDVEMDQYSVTLDRGTCLIGYYDYDEKVFRDKSADRIFSDSLAELLRNGDITISNQQNISVDGYPAISFDLRIPSGRPTMYTHSVLVIAQPRVYNYMFVSHDQAQMTKPDVLKFFNSFHIQK